MKKTFKMTPNYFRVSFIIAILIAAVLITYGWIITPNVRLISIAGAYVIIMIYAFYIGFFLPKIYHSNSKILKFSFYTGLLAGLIFLSEIVSEYIILPEDNTILGLLEFGSVFLVYFIASIIFTYRNGKLKHTLPVTITSAVVGSLIWLIATLFVFYIFKGTHRQELVFRAEGNYQDFASSGMKDFNTFILEDFYGAAFFHLLLVPIMSTLLGTLGWVFGRLSFMVVHFRRNHGKEE